MGAGTGSLLRNKMYEMTATEINFNAIHVLIQNVDFRRNGRGETMVVTEGKK